MSEPFMICDVKTHTAGDGYAWKYRHYRTMDEGAPLARVVYLHGIQSHGGWYERSCRRLAEEGFEVFFLDRRGSGLNEKARGDTPSFRRLLDDLAEFLAPFRGTGKTFLVAVSWGAKLAVALQRRHPGLVDGLALLCPGFFPHVTLPAGQRWKILFWRLFFRPRKLYPIPLNDPELFTSSPIWQQFLRKDKLSLHQATARFLVESARLDGYLRWVPRHVQLPVLMMLAGQDRIIDNARTRAYVERFASRDRQVIEYPEAHHTLEFEPDPEGFLRDLVKWLKDHSM